MGRLFPLAVFVGSILLAFTPAPAGAYAPIIGQIPSPVIGNTPTTGSQPYSFCALNLDTLAWDDTTPVDQLLWSYEIPSPAKYAINGVKPINSGINNAINPPLENQINNTMNTIQGADDVDPDRQPHTITIRNIELYPYGGAPSNDQTSDSQDWNRNMQPVTFWCSDGQSATSSTVMFFTDNRYINGLPIGTNRLSNVCGYVHHDFDDKLLNSNNWSVSDPLSGFITTGTWTDGRGLCFTVSPRGNNWGSVATPMGTVTLVDNMVYRVRIVMNCTQMSPGKTPFWDFILENWNGDPTRGLNLYGVDTFFLDNEGGANAIITKPLGTEVSIIWAPAAFQTPQWRSTSTGIFAHNPAPPTGNGIDYSLVKDAALRFRVMDLDANVALLNDQKSGSICMQNVIVESMPFNKMRVDREVLRTSSFAPASNTAPGGSVFATSITGATINFNSGKLTITPGSGTPSQVDIVTITPAIDTRYEYGNWATIADDWPIPWESNKLYLFEADLSAPNQAGEDHPYDVLWMNMEPVTNEVITESYVTATHAIATPRQGAPQTYYMFYYSGNKTWSKVPAFAFLRWRLRFGNSQNLDWPYASDDTNPGGVTVHAIRVSQVIFDGSSPDPYAYACGLP